MPAVEGKARDLEADLAFINFEHSTAEQFADVAIIGWPYAIRRAMEAEEKVDRLENELHMLQDSMNKGRCFG